MLVVFCISLVIGGSCGHAGRTTAIAGTSARTSVEVHERWLVGIWTWSDVSPEAARASAEAVKYSEDGTHTRGVLRDGRYVEQPHFGPTPGFISRWSFRDTRLFFDLDGAEESVQVTRYGDAVFRTECSNGGERYVFWYARAQGDGR